MSEKTLVVEFDEKKINELFTNINQCHLPGATIGVAIDGRPVYRKGFGLASIELPIALSPSIRMRIHSVSKHFTCLAYLLLCEDGRAGIDDELGVHFPEFHPVTKRVTMGQLMSNVSGLRDLHGLNFNFCGQEWAASATDIMSTYRTLGDFDAEPGTTWIYNNAGFTLVSLAIERISGQSFGEFLRERIFEPVGMYETLLRRKGRDLDFVPNSATMHMTAPDGSFVKYYVGGDRGGTGGVVSTVNDLLRWLAHMNAPRVGNTSTWALLKTPKVLANGTKTDYGFGLFSNTYCGVETLFAPGGGMGGNAQVLKVPAANLDIVVVVNREDVSSREICLRILHACLPGLKSDKKPITGPVSTGAYRSPNTGRVIRLYSQDGQQATEIGGYGEMLLSPDEKGVLRPPNSSAMPHQCSIVPFGDAASPSKLNFSHYGNADELVRIDAAMNPGLAVIAGRYRSEAAGFDAVISLTGMRTAGRFGLLEHTLEYMAEGVWHAKAVSSIAAFNMTGILSFEGDGFRFWSYCTCGLPFQRVN